VQNVTESVHWNTRCSFESTHVAFHRDDSVLVQVEYGHKKLAGAHVEGLAALIQRNYLAKHFKVMPFSFETIEHFDIKHDGKHVGVVEVELEYILSNS